MNQTKTTKCAACESVQGVQIGVLHVCSSCGFVWLNPRESDAWYQSFYADGEYDNASRPNGGKRAATGCAEAEIVYSRLHRLCGDMPRVLDIGCGYGHVLSRFGASGAELYGVEPSLACQTRLSELGVEMCASLCAAGYEVVVMRHVLEHVPDPAATLLDVAGALVDDGIVYIAVPDTLHLKNPKAGLWKQAAHVSHFSAPTLERMCAGAGLVPVHMQEATDELWGIFQKGEPRTEFRNVYREQSAILRRGGLMMNREKKEVRARDRKNTVVKALALELDRLSRDGGDSMLDVRIRVGRNNATNTGAAECNGLLTVDGLRSCMDMLGGAPVKVEAPVPDNPAKTKTSKKKPATPSKE